MINPSDIKQKAEKLYPKFLQAWLNNECFFPITFSVGKRATKDYIALRDAIALLKQQSQDQLGYGYNIEFETVNTRSLGQQTLPKNICIKTEQDYLKLIKKTKEFTQFKENVALIRQEVPQLTPWVCENPKPVIKYCDRWPDLLKVCQYFQSNPQPNLYIRELPIPIHTKFIEQNIGILKTLLEEIIPPQHLQNIEHETNSKSKFLKRFNLKQSEDLIRLRILDISLKQQHNFPVNDLSTPLSEFKKLNLAGHRCFITENLMNFLTLPPLKNSFVLFGQGYKLQILKSVSWLSHCPIYYWGDLDVEGFKILSQLRSYFPQTHSIMMDTITFETFKKFAVSVSQTKIETLTHLTPEEQSLLSYLALHQYRLEQEHIFQNYAIQKLKNLQ